MDDGVNELERQVQRGSLFTHTLLTEQAERANTTEALVNGLIDVLIQDGVIEADRLRQAAEAVQDETAAAGNLATVGVAIRIDGDEADEPPAIVDCAARLPICQAACCRMRFALSVPEIESGPVKWDLGRPYFNRRGPDGYCHQCDSTTHACGVSEQRPGVCRRYSCAGDGRIWKDFDAMELNNEWIAANLGGDEPGPVEVYMNAYTR